MKRVICDQRTRFANQTGPRLRRLRYLLNRTAIGFIIGLSLSVPASRGAAPPPASAVPAAWGTIETTPLYLEATTDLLASTPRPDQTPLWYFAVSSPAELRTVLERVGFTEPLLSRLLEPALCKAERGGFVVLLPTEVVIDLPPATRQALYEVLARTPGNPNHEMPLFIPDDLATWLAGTHLSATQKRVWQQLVWRRGHLSAFSDLPVMIKLATSSDEVAAACRAVTRVKTFTARIQPAHGAQDAFLEYWSAGGRNLDALPLLHAIAERTDGPGLDLCHLLPSLARERLYTYPSLSDIIGGRLPDCQWTALNFFAANPQPYFLDGRTSYLELTENYTQIEQPGQLGDLFCFVTRAGVVYHSCIYLADDIVFTKNGVNPLAPWILMKLATVETIYDRGDGSRAVFYRQKPAGRL